METGWTELDAVHLLNRTTFRVSPQDVEAALSLGKEETVNRLVDGMPLSGEKKPVAPLEELSADGKPLTPDNITDEQTYWLYRMAVSDEPLIEKMTLFWHDHFATSYRKVRDVRLMRRQNELFRRLALGSFHELVLEVGREPAMMIWLDANSNKKGKPNENYAREVMELFTLGIGNYTEQDVKEAARAFTGWGYDRNSGKTAFAPKQHDTGVKQVLGEKGNFDESSVVDVLFRQKALAPFMARKLLNEFGTPNPPETWVAQVAADFAEKETVREVLRALLLSDEFYKPEYRQTIVKSPAEYVAGILRAFEIPPSKSFIASMRKMGQELYLPPDVAGWDGGAEWLIASSLLTRSQFAESISKRIKNTFFVSESYVPERKDKAESWVDLWSRNAGVWGLGEQSQKVLAKFADDTFVHVSSKMNGMRGLLQLIMICPEAQMK
ncbi:DUF1800 domain-containing protein [Paenibacillus ginsengarvi]|uniref:DUF1800 domain-containing protein n=1 Tax=Paenibacillus ginsengarvi TaxID=400777 RepID=A0A3B0BMH6_9BACL|nr:DUF1800 domain-containing protein [Paenibacillus ginsengarvi]RKN74230.1 DUF1800 domain-containing protein [Paenibacillus ginsengarvi]